MKASPIRLIRVRAIRTLPGLLLAAIALPAGAMTVSAPAGGAVPSNTPLIVQWVSTPGPGKVDISLYSSGQSFSVASGHLNTGQTTFALPSYFSCNPGEEFRVKIRRYTLHPGGDPYIQTEDLGFSAPFTFACPLTITKQVVNTTGRHVGGTFRMRVQCEPGSQTFADIAGSGQGSFTRKVHVPPGSTVCTVQETGMPLPPRGCNWLTTYPGGQQQAPGGPAVVVVNTLQCGPVTPPGPR